MAREALKAGDTVYELCRYNNDVLTWPVRHITDNVACVGLGGAHIRHFNLDELGNGRWFRNYPYAHIVIGAAAFWLGRAVAVVVGMALLALTIISFAVLAAIGLRLGGL